MLAGVTLDDYAEHTLADGTDAEFRTYLNTLEIDESFAVSTSSIRVDAATWGRIPRSYLRLTADRSMPVALQDRFIREADALTPHNPFDVGSLDSSHAGFLVRPDAAAHLIASRVAAPAA